MDSIPDGNKTPVIINIMPGRYEERTSVSRGKHFVTLRGLVKSREDVVLTDGAGKWGVLSASANDFRAENFTIENTAGPTAGPNMALFCDGKRQVFDNLLIKGWQDTLGSWNGNVAYFHNCEIWGSVDFIYSGGTALFDQCDIVEIRDTGGPIAAPSTPKEVEFGLVFLNCRLLKGPGVQVGSSTLMRPWRPDGHTAYINCSMDDHISTKGWSEWDGREETCRAIEYGSKTLDGQPIDLSNRAAWVKVVTPGQALAYNVTNILGGWNPVARNFDAVVAADGSGDFSTIQEAVAAAPEYSSTPLVLLIKPGKYPGQLLVPETKSNLRFISEDLENTILTYDLNVKETNSTTIMAYKGTGVIVLGDGFHAENITFENTSGDHGQALALRVDGDRALFKNCRMLGWQDTLMINKGRQYFTNCYIEGRVDFIYGSATAVFDHCEIHSKNGGHITAASTPEDKSFGFVFLDCQLTGDEMPWVDSPDPSKAKVWRKPNADLGRPWRPYANVAYIRCEMGDHIKPEGWNNWRNPENEKTARYSEYRSTGPGAQPETRVPWSKQLTDEEAQQYTVTNILIGKDKWTLFAQQ